MYRNVRDIQGENAERIEKCMQFSLSIQHGKDRLSAVIISKDLAVTSLHLITNEENRKLGAEVIVCSFDGVAHEMEICAWDQKYDFVAFKRKQGNNERTCFVNGPKCISEKNKA